MSIIVEQTSEEISPDKWKWEIYFKGEEKDLDKIEFVEYTLHPTFINPVRKIYDRDTGFKLQTSGWGTFQVYLRIKLRGKSKEVLESLNISFSKTVRKRLQL
jgi:transcription initiation factor IIF auxiliary subunit